MRAMARRDFSQPERTAIFLSTSSPENWKAPAKVRREPRPSCGKGSDSGRFGERGAD